MIRFMIVCFLFLGWAFYELSGGADFEPELRAETVPAPEPVVEVALADPVTPQVVEETAPETIQERLATALVTPAVTEAVTEQAVALAEDTASADIVEAVAEIAPEVVAEIIEEPVPVDLRQVAGSRVNMRAGPSTDFSVLITLDGGTTTEVIDRNNDGWVLVRVQDTGQEGWMAERLLEPVNG